MRLELFERFERFELRSVTKPALNMLRLYNLLRPVRQSLKLLRSYHTRNITLYLTDNANLLAAVSYLFGNWHEGCLRRGVHKDFSGTARTLNIELLEPFELLLWAEA